MKASCTVSGRLARLPETKAAVYSKVHHLKEWRYHCWNTACELVGVYPQKLDVVHCLNGFQGAIHAV